jgi:hypothetical protein
MEGWRGGGMEGRKNTPEWGDRSRPVRGYHVTLSTNFYCKDRSVGRKLIDTNLWLASETVTKAQAAITR